MSYGKFKEKISINKKDKKINKEFKKNKVFYYKIKKKIQIDI